MSNALELRRITKRFPGVVANDRVDLAVEPGEIRALVGENGAGKTTLMRVAYGMYQPDEGEIFVAGGERRFRSPLDAIRAGVGMVHQHFMLFPTLTVAENVTFGDEPRRKGLVDRSEARSRVEQLAAGLDLTVDPDARVGDLSLGLRQGVEILKALYRGAEVLILDEPTAVLTPGERDALFNTIRGLAAQNRAVIFITHKLDEVMELADRTTVMRDGKVTGTVATQDSSPRELSRLMVGRDVILRIGRTARQVGEPVLEVGGLEVLGRAGRPMVHDVSFQVSSGEIVGIAGAAGNGQDELVESLAGVRRAVAGRVRLRGIDVTELPIRDRRGRGLAWIPAERDEEGLALEATIGDNLLMGSEHTSVWKRSMLSRPKAQHRAQEILSRWRIKTPGLRRVARSLSGGNRQKLVVGREMELCDGMLLVEQPTRGVDIGTTETIYRRFLERRDSGWALLLVSSELQELLTLADRILVMYRGCIAGELSGDEATEEGLALLMAGGGPERREESL